MIGIVGGCTFFILFFPCSRFAVSDSIMGGSSSSDPSYTVTNYCSFNPRKIAVSGAEIFSSVFSSYKVAA